MISGLQNALKNAIDVIAPPATPFQDFKYHWKQLMNFYTNHSDCKASIESTRIPVHLEKLLEILLREEKDAEEVGPCLEYVLQHKLLDLLVTLAEAETPPGIRLVCLSFVRRFLTASKHTLLHHVSVYLPVRRLILLCNGSVPSAIENEEIKFLLTLCFWVSKYPHITNIVNDAVVAPDTNSSIKHPVSKLDPQSVTLAPMRRENNLLFEALETRTSVALVDPNLYASESSRRKSEPIFDSHSRRTESYGALTRNTSRSDDSSKGVSQSSTPLSQKAVLNEASPRKLQDVPIFQKDVRMENSGSGRKGHQELLPEVSEGTSRSKCILLDSLMSYCNSADHHVRVHACEGLLVLASLDDPSFANIATNSDLGVVVSSRLERLFNSIPAHVDIAGLEDLEVTWALDTPLLSDDKKFPGCRQIASLFMWLDFCDQLTKEANPQVGVAVAKHVRKVFDDTLTPLLSSHHAVLVTSLANKFLKEVTSMPLNIELSYWLVGRRRDPDEITERWPWSVMQKLMENCESDNDCLVLETLKLFETMVEKRDEHMLHCLFLGYLNTRGYYDNGAADSAIASWSDEEDERERGKNSTLDLSQHHSRTLAPSNIHRIINCFLSVVPRQLQTDSDVNNYETYTGDWEKQYSSVLKDCALFAWPLEAVNGDDCASSDSRPEADHGSARFHMGPFLSTLLDKVANIPRQKYDVNLQLTIIISKLCLLPHPYLHEFLLNPLIPLAPGKKSLFLCLQKVVKQLVSQVQKIPNYKQMLKDTRRRLLEDSSEDSLEDNILCESVIITEEFCKELAAIAYVKYHHSM